MYSFVVFGAVAESNQRHNTLGNTDTVCPCHCEGLHHKALDMVVLILFCRKFIVIDLKSAILFPHLNIFLRLTYEKSGQIMYQNIHLILYL